MKQNMKRMLLVLCMAVCFFALSEKQLVESTHTEVRAERSFTLLEDVNCPAVLAEQCFVTNEADVAQFGSEEGCKKTARVYYEAICAYFGTQPQAEQLAGFTLN